MLADGTWIFLLEALLALVLGALIVWWTLPRKPKSRGDAQAEAGERPPQGPPQP